MLGIVVIGNEHGWKIYEKYENYEQRKQKKKFLI